MEVEADENLDVNWKCQDMEAGLEPMIDPRKEHSLFNFDNHDFESQVNRSCNQSELQYGDSDVEMFDKG